MSLEPAFEKAKRDMAGIRPYVVAAKSGCNYEGGGFRLAFFNRRFLVSYPEVRVEEIGGGSPPPMWLQLILLHYLLTADGTPVADQWLTYRHLPGTSLFEQRFTNMAIVSLIKTFGHDLAGFGRAALSLGGTSLSRTGDAAFRFLALPRIPMACILYLGDGEVSSSVSILFDAAAPSYLPAEDLSIVGGYLSGSLRGHKGRAEGEV